MLQNILRLCLFSLFYPTSVTPRLFQTWLWYQAIWSVNGICGVREAYYQPAPSQLCRAAKEKPVVDARVRPYITAREKPVTEEREKYCVIREENSQTRKKPVAVGREYYCGRGQQPVVGLFPIHQLKLLYSLLLIP